MKTTTLKTPKTKTLNLANPRPNSWFLGLGLAKLRVLGYFLRFRVLGVRVTVNPKKGEQRKKKSLNIRVSGERICELQEKMSCEKKSERHKDKERRTKSTLINKRRETCLLRKRREETDVPLKAPYQSVSADGRN